MTNILDTTNKYVQKSLKKYDLNETEKKILDYIIKNPDSPLTELQSNFRISRGSSIYTVKKLTARGLLVEKSDGKKNLYRAVKTIMEKHVTECSVDELFVIIRKAKHTRLYGIQSDGAIREIVRKMKLAPRSIEKIHRVQKQRSIIIESIFSKNSLKYIQTISESIIKSHVGRPAIFYEITESLPGNYDIYFDKTAVYIADYKGDIATILHERELAELLITVFGLLKKTAVKKSSSEVYGI